MDIESPSAKTAGVNRSVGSYAKPIPAIQVYNIIKQIPRALKEVLRD